MRLRWRRIISGKFNPHDVGRSNYQDTAVSGTYGNSAKNPYVQQVREKFLRVFRGPLVVYPYFSASTETENRLSHFFTFSCIVKEEMGLLLRLKSNFYPSYISTSRSYYHYITNDIKCQDILSNMWCNILQRCLQCSEHARLVPLNQLNSCGNLRDTQLNRPSQGWDTQHWLKEAAEVS